MSLQDSLTSTRQGRANGNSGRPLFLVCARFEGEPLPVWPSLCSPPDTLCAGSEALKGVFIIYGLGPWLPSASL